MQKTGKKNFITTLAEKDLAYVWHPFTQAKTQPSPIPIVRAKGLYLYCENKEKYLDGISSWWVNLHGHAHPYIAEKISSQAKLLEHVIFAGFTHQPAIDLAQRLIAILPGQMDKVFYTDNGSTAVEAALKMALQYWHNQNPNTKKTKVICFKKGYHGDTFGAMSAAGKNEFNQPFWKHLFEVASIDPPWDGQEEKSLFQLQRILSEGQSACFIFEPFILGVGGMRIYSKKGLNLLLQLCQEHHVIKIADEVMTGFGRTGPLFACDQLSEKPDIICLSKGLTGGFLPLGVTACNRKIYNAFLSDNLQKALLHGHSYCANPIACISALASLDLLQKKDCENKRQSIQALHKNFCRKWKDHPRLKRCKYIGTILVLEYLSDTSSYFESFRNKLYQFFLKRKILLRPLGNVLYVLPPYCIGEQELTFIYETIICTLEKKL